MKSNINNSETTLIWDKSALKNLPVKGGLIPSGDERIERYSEDSMMRGRPDAVLVARDERDVAEVLAFCNGKKIPVTFCGSQTSMTGASVPLEGLLVSTEKLEGVICISKEGKTPTATVRPGTVVADFQRAVADTGFFYPVAPTSRDECRIASNVATNATGEDSYKYGPVRLYVKMLKIILPNGKERVLEREEGETPLWNFNRGGYLMEWKNPIDLIIGSEGTLGFISEAEFRLLPRAKDFFSALIPMPSTETAVNFAIETALKKNGLDPRALEFVDTGALEIMRTAEGFPPLPNETRALLYIKQEYEDNQDKEKWFQKWYDESARLAGKSLADEILIADTHKKQEDFRLWRHRIPEFQNEKWRAYWSEGGGKVESDWWVPAGRFSEMMAFFYDVARGTGFPYIAYAHIGRGHPHTNLGTKNAIEREIAREAVRKCCRKAARLGGGVAGEHGIGKMHHGLMKIQYPPIAIEHMKKWKREFDPNWILGRGNIFDAY